MKITRKGKGQLGGAAVLIGVALPLLIGMVALGVDIGYVYATKNELQNIADSAALAATGQLGNIYSGMSYENQQTYVADPETIVNIAQEVAASYHAGQNLFTINASDVKLGLWDTGNNTFTPTLNQPDAVRVTARRDDDANGPVIASFAKIFEMMGAEKPEIVDVRAVATAALTGQSTAEPGDLQLPVGVSTNFFQGASPEAFCGTVIKFSPTKDPDACAGWTTFSDSPASDQKVQKILEDLIENSFVQAGETEFQFINGDLSEGTFEELMTRFQDEGHDVDGVYDPDYPAVEPNRVSSDAARVPICEYDGEIKKCLDADVGVEGKHLQYPPCSGASGCSGAWRYAHEWETTVVVYDDAEDCTPGKDMPIAGFAQVVVYNVGYPSNKIVAARIRCDYVDSSATRGGGGNYGRKGPIPGLVQ